MEEFMGKIKSGAEKFKKGAKKVTKQVVRKTNDAVSQTKLRFAINENESKIAELYEEMGRTVYGDYLKNGSAEESMVDKCAHIDKLFEEIDSLKENLAELKQSVKCPKCSQYNKSGSLYCSHCGTALDFSDVTEDEAAEEVDEEELKPRRVVTIRAEKPDSDED